MLLTLLPFAAWADGVDVAVGEYTVNISKQIMTTATAPTVNSVKQGENGAAYEVKPGYRYQTIGHKVDAVSAEGTYYFEIAITGAQKVLYVPFYVATERNVEVVSDATSFGNSLDNGFLKEYYETYPFCDVWWQYASNAGKILYPGQVPADNQGATTGQSYDWSANAEAKANAIAWANDLFNGDYANQLSHSFGAFQTAGNVPAYGFVVPETYAAGDYNVLITNGDNSHVWATTGTTPMVLTPGSYSWTTTSELNNDWGLNVAGNSEPKFFVYPAELTGVQADAVSAVEVTLDPNVINVLYPDNVGGVIPAVTANDFSISGTYPTGITTAEEAKASLVASGILRIQTVADAAIPALTGSVKYYFDINDENLANSAWAGATIHLAKNGDLNVIARPLSHESIVITANPNDAAYDATTQSYSYEFNATAREPKPFVTIGAYDPAVTTNRLAETTDFTYSWAFNKNANGVAEDPADANTAGTPTVTITAVDGSGYTGSTTFTFDITPKTFYNGNNNVVSINGLADQTYNRGLAITQPFTVKDTELNYDMVAGRDFNEVVVWANNENATPANAQDAQKASVTITPTGNYATRNNENDNAVGRFIINPKNINDADIVFDGVVDKTYDFGNELTQVAPALKWKYTDNNNQEQTDDIPAIFAYTYANNVNVGTATITANIATDLATEELQNAAKNYTATDPGKTKNFQIKPKKLTDIDDLTITVGDAVYNEDDAVTPSITVTYGNPAVELTANDYEIPAQDGWVNNINVTPDGATDAEKASVTIIGKGNFAAVNEQGIPVSVSQTFSIAKKPVKLTAVGGMTMPYGTAKADFGFTYTTNLTKITSMDAFIQKFGGSVDYAPYTNEEASQVINTPFNELAEGNYKVRATWTQKSATAAPANTPAAQLVNYDTQAQIDARANYDLTQAEYVLGTFTIGKAALTIVPQNAEKFYGVTTDPALTYKVFNGSTEVTTALNWTTEPQYVREEGDDAGEYAITISNTPVLPNYELTYTATATFTIKPFPITITANPQTILFGSTPNLNAEYNSMVKKVDGEVESFDNYITTVTISPTQLANGDVIDRGENGLGLTLTWDKTVVGEDGVYAKALVPAWTSTNYAVTMVEGTLTIKNDAPSIELVRVAKAKFDTDENTAAGYVAQYSGKTVDVNIKYNDAEAYNTFKGGQWYAMVLPFETDAKMISDAFGYAIVDLLRTSNTDKNRTYFDLLMNTDKIPANTPFIIKAWDDIDMHLDEGEEAAGVFFDDVDIEAPSAENGNLIASDAAGNQFIGTYTGKIGFGGANSKDYWFSLTDGEIKQPSTTAYLRQLSAYIKLTSSADPAAHEFIIEEPNGTTTVINAIGVETKADGQGIYNLNGMKMQSAPSQKGVYILNGKKVVIK